MPAVPYVDIATLDPQSLAVFDRVAATTGFVPNSLLTYFHRPAIGRAILGMMGAVYGDPDSTLPPAIKGKLGLLCSAINGCAYCTSHQCHVASHPPGGAAGLSEAQVRDLVSGADLGADPLEQACFTYARAASFDPNSVSPEMLVDLQTVLTPAQLVELAGIVGVWKMVNTIHDSLNLPIEDAVAGHAGLIAAAGLEVAA